MAKKGQQADQGEPAAAKKAPGLSPEDATRARRLTMLVGLGALNTLWAAFLWAELLVARQGGKPFCAVGEGFDCTALWDGPFASAIHGATGMPVAGWGVVYGIAALVLPLLALLRHAEGRPSPALLTGLRIVGLTGIVSLAVLVVASFLAGTVCLGCLGTYVLVTAYSALALAGFKGAGFPDMGGGVGVAAATTIVAFLALLYPGLSTPKNLQTEGQKAIEQIASQNDGPKDSPRSTATPPKVPHTTTGTGSPQAERPAEPEDPVERLKAFLAGAPPPLLQGISDSLHIYRTAPTVAVQTARSVLGDANAPLLITEFTDARCGHCAQLHATLKAIHEAVPPGSFKVEPRHFPLDGNCNEKIPRKSDDGVSCVAAKAQICLEGDPKAFDFAGALFENGPTLSTEQVWTIASRFTDVNKLKTCVADAATAKKLQDDIQWAIDHNLDGTPLVLLNGKKATSFGPFLFAMILTGGDANHPAFARLPPPDKNAHVH